MSASDPLREGLEALVAEWSTGCGSFGIQLICANRLRALLAEAAPAVEVTDAMVERAALVYEPHGHHSRCAGGNPCDCYFESDRRRTRAALVAALILEES